MNHLQTKFGERLHLLRRKEGISGEALGPLLHLSGRLIYRYERGEVEPQLSNVIAIAKHFNVSLDYLCGLSDIPNHSTEEAFFSQLRDKLDADADTFRQMREMCDEQISKKEGEIQK